MMLYVILHWPEQKTLDMCVGMGIPFCNLYSLVF
jgi:hypothetical protein